MNIKLEKTVYSIAQKVRTWAEEKAKDSNGIYPESLQGLCAISAAKLHHELSLNSIHATLNLAPGHVFVMVDDHIVDVTATQFREFRNTKICILHERMACEHEFYDVERKFTTRAALVKVQVSQGWPSDEIAYSNELE